MTEIILHGLIAKKFKARHKFHNIHKPSDCIRAINANYPGFTKFFQSSAEANQNYEMIVDDNVISSATQALQKRSIKKIEIVPAVSGSANFIAAFVVQLIVGLVMAGIQYLATPIPENEPAAAILMPKATSFMFTNRDNIADQFSTIPLGYGALRIGSKIVESAITAIDLNTVEAKNRPGLNLRAAGAMSLQGGKGEY
jgi:predicted phage tail protein